MEASDLSRLKFSSTIAFHCIFPPLSIGLGLILVIMEAMWLRTGKPLYRDMTRFWVKIYALKRVKVTICPIAARDCHTVKSTDPCPHRRSAGFNTT
jgi:hypothetical protein